MSEGESTVQTGKKGFLETTIAGAAGGASLVIVGHPLDTIKVRIQTMQIVKGETPPYTGALDCAKKTFYKEGFRGFYKGVTPPLLAVTPMYSLCFFGYEIGKRIWTTEESYRDLRLLDIAAAGATSAIFTTPIQAPQVQKTFIFQSFQLLKLFLNFLGKNKMRITNPKGQGLRWNHPMC